MNSTIEFAGVEIISNPRTSTASSFASQRRYRNFSGVPTGKFDSTQRYFNIRVPDDQVNILDNMRIDYWRPRNPDDEGYFPTFVQIDIGNRKNKPDELTCQVYLVQGDNAPIPLDAESIGTLDDLYIKEAFIKASIAEKKNHPGKYKLWADVVYVVQNLRADPFAKMFDNGNPSNNDIDNLPF